MNDQDERPAATVRTMEMVVALALFVFGLVVIYDSLRLGAKWGSDGPEAGYFPFYIGVLICVSTAVVFFRALGTKARNSFVSRDALALVMKMLLPSIVYVVLIAFLGIYVASTIYIVFFMVWLGKYSWAKAIAVGLGVSLVFFLMFEVWFKVPLPKGPLEGALGLL
jgi:ABC-type polysaccharide/polyol phosphate export permease